MKHLKKFNEGRESDPDCFLCQGEGKDPHCPVCGKELDYGTGDDEDIPHDDDFELDKPEKSILRGWEFRDMIEKCVDDNCREIPRNHSLLAYEGTEVDKHGIIDDIIDLLEQKYIVTEK